MKYLLFIILLLLMCFHSINAHSSTYLGVYLENLSDAERRAMRINEGVRIEDVVEGSPAHNAGLQTDDVILKIDNTSVRDSDGLVEIISAKQPGDKIELLYLSGTKKNKTTLVLGQRNNRIFPDLNLLDTKTKHLGLKMQNLTLQLKEYFQVKHGVLVAEVMTGTPADRAGIKAGDIITFAADKPVDAISDVRDAIKERKAGDRIRLSINRTGKRLDIEVEIEETDSLFSIDMDNQIIILGKDQVIDFSGLGQWFRNVVPDSTKKELESKLNQLQNELDQLRKRFTK